MQSSNKERKVKRSAGFCEASLQTSINNRLLIARIEAEKIRLLDMVSTYSIFVLGGARKNMRSRVRDPDGFLKTV